MIDSFNEDKLLEQLAKFDQKSLVVFALSCAERMLPNFQRFSKEHCCGNIQPLRQALNLAWKWLEIGHVDNSEAMETILACEVQAPNTEDYSSLYVSPALDAAIAASNVVRLLILPNAERAVEIAMFACDTIDMYVQVINDMTSNTPDIEEKIRLHPMMQRELRNQQEALEAIMDGISLEDAAARWRSPELSNIDLS